MTFTQSVKHVLSNYANFNGRASRSEFWWFYLFGLLCYIAAIILSSIMSLGGGSMGIAGGILVFGLMLGLFIPSLSVAARRLHDSDMSGWWQLLNLVPLGAFVLLYFYARRGSDGENRFGNPTDSNLTLRKM